MLCGGERVTLDDPNLHEGFYLSPCVVTECTDTMKLVQEEIFGAVVAVLPFDTEEEAVSRANSSPFGLAAGVMTKYGPPPHSRGNYWKIIGMQRGPYT